MAQSFPPGHRRIRSLQRAALIRIYAAGPEQAPLRTALRTLGFAVPDDDDPFDQLAQAADPTSGVPDVHPLRLAFAAMEALNGPTTLTPAEQDERLTPVVNQLLRQPFPADDAAAEELRDIVRAALRAGSEVPTPERWAAFRSAVTDAAPATVLREELTKILAMTCRATFRDLRGEIVSKVESRFEIDDPTPIDAIAPALLPQNWPQCSDFFISLTPQPALDARCDKATGGTLTASCTFWYGVLEEKVGGAPDGWFPDTHLRIAWDRQAKDKIIIRYDLLPPIAGERTVLKVDQGLLEVHQRRTGYVVTAGQYLLFDSRFLPEGGQSLGSLACDLGWLDCAINQFRCTPQASNSPEVETAPGDWEGAAGPDAQIQQALNRCEAHLRETAADVTAQFRAARERDRAGEYDLDDYIADLAQAYQRGIRDGARSLQDQALLARGTLKMFRDLARVWTGPS